MTICASVPEDTSRDKPNPEQRKNTGENVISLPKIAEVYQVIKQKHIVIRDLMFLLFTTIILLTVSTLNAQDTLRVMHYNILNYGNYTTYCTQSNNNMNNKDVWLRTIFKYADADVITVNEMASGINYAQRLLDSTLNVGGVNYYSRAGFQNFSGGSIANMLFYDNRKLVLTTQYAVPTDLRDFNFYTFYYKIPPGTAVTDTAFINFIVVHLKAGRSSTDAARRASMTSTLMNYLSANNKTGNYLLLGDLNVYNSNEQAYQNLTHSAPSSQRFHDPLDSEGDWHDNSAFSSIHTQSTSAGGSGCMASGGLDDRFDFILASTDIMQGNKLYSYIAGSYKTIGNDGLHFNTSITAAPQNNSVPPIVLSALASNSDHLPVMLSIRTDALVNLYPLDFPDYSIKVFPNPASEYIIISGLPQGERMWECSLLNITGQVIKQEIIRGGIREFKLCLQDINAGVYFLRIQDSHTSSVSTGKIIVSKNSYE